MRVTVEGKAFKLRDRALHVYTEANRVIQFKTLCSGAQDKLIEVPIHLFDYLIDTRHLEL